MPSINYKKNKQVISDLDLLLIEMWFLSNLRNKKIRFNPKPILDLFHVEQKQPPKVEENFVDLHFEIAKKVDSLIAQFDLELQNNEPQMVTSTQRKLPLIDSIEIRQPNIKQPQMSVFKPATIPTLNFGEVTPEEDFFEIVEPPEFIEVDDNLQQQRQETQSFMVGEKEKQTFRSLIGLGRIKVNNKKPTKQTKPKTAKTKKPVEQKNGFAVKKEELEKTRQEIEERKKQLQKAKEKEKAKKLELKKQRKEKLKQEKLKKLEQKKIEKERKLEKIKKLKEEKLKQKEQERKEKIKAKELEKEVNEKIEKLKKEKSKISNKKEKQVEPAGMEKFIKPSNKEKNDFDKDVEKLIPIIDGLLEKLPENEIEKFAKSKDFALYEKVVNKYKNM